VTLNNNQSINLTLYRTIFQY